MKEDYDYKYWYHKNCEEMKFLEQQNMVLMDKYADLARAIGIECDSWFGDPLLTHVEIVRKAKEIYDKANSRN